MLPETRDASRCSKSSFSECSKHLQDALDKYQAMLEMGKCLCRKAIDQIGVSCCSLGPTGLIARTAPEQLDSTDVKPRDTASKPTSNALHFKSQHQAQQVTPAEADPEPCTTTDLERNAASEHVLLKVSGMTCTGCARKLTNVVDQIAGLSHPKVVFVTETAEFDLDSNVTSIENVSQQIEKNTGFKVSSIIDGYQQLDLTMSPDMAKKYMDDHHAGIATLTREGKTLVRVTYNPRITGARSLLAPGISLAPPTEDSGASKEEAHLRSMLLRFLASTALTVPVAVLAWADIAVPKRTREIASLVLATLVQCIAVQEFYIGAVKALVYSRVVEMDMLVVISITAAYGYSVVAFGLEQAGYRLEQGEFFETSTVLITLVLLGRLVSAYTRVRAVSAVSLRSLQAESANIIEEDGSARTIDARLLQFGDRIRINAHARVVTDGKILAGESAINESMLTGESALVHKEVGDDVIAGTINGPGALDIGLTRLPGENSITDIAKLVEGAAGAKPRMQNLADRIAAIFVPSVLAIATVVFAIWMVVATRVRHLSGGGAVGIAITYGIAVLAVSCPCALGLAVPMVLVITGGAAAKLGVIIKAADAVERSAKITDVVFDKTGTLTNGDLWVVHEQLFLDCHDASEVVGLTKALANSNTHPVSMAVASKFAQTDGPSLHLENIQSVPGAGVYGQYKKTLKARLGNPYWLGLAEDSRVMPLLDRGLTCLCLTLDDKLLAAWGLEDSIRAEAPAVLSELHRRNITCHIVSGDAQLAVERVANALGVAMHHAMARHAPAEKQQYVENLQALGRGVVFCGDGTNDAVAVAQADIGVQIGTASDVTKTVADVVLLGDLTGLTTFLDVSRQSLWRVRFNFVWAAVYNVFAILLAAGAFVKARIPPAYAGIGEVVSVVPVMVAAASMAWIGKSRT